MVKIQIDSTFKIRHETPFDVARREALLDEALGDGRFTKTAERLREGRLPERGLSLAACADGRLVGTVRLWNISAGPGARRCCWGRSRWRRFPRCGVGGALMRHALGEAQRRGHQAVLLVGDAPYYGRFGFTAEQTGALWLPGPYARERLLAHELVPGALEDARGLINPTGRIEPKTAVVARLARAA